MVIPPGNVFMPNCAAFYVDCATVRGVSAHSHGCMSFISAAVCGKRIVNSWGIPQCFLKSTAPHFNYIIPQVV